MFPAQSQQLYKGPFRSSLALGRFDIVSHLQHITTGDEVGVANLELTQPGHDN